MNGTAIWPLQRLDSIIFSPLSPAFHFTLLLPVLNQDQTQTLSNDLDINWLARIDRVMRVIRNRREHHIDSGVCARVGAQRKTVGNPVESEKRWAADRSGGVRHGAKALRTREGRNGSDKVGRFTHICKRGRHLLGRDDNRMRVDNFVRQA